MVKSPEVPLLYHRPEESKTQLQMEKKKQDNIPDNQIDKLKTTVALSGGYRGVIEELVYLLNFYYIYLLIYLLRKIPFEPQRQISSVPQTSESPVTKTTLVGVCVCETLFSWIVL